MSYPLAGIWLVEKMFLCGQRADPAVSLFVSYSG